ncbi:uncharacterized protein LOC110022981 [Phalaenopsis equestris]|uniref:uncharacterized protein LOC110022981 n=1 Tax=Phalaenopsis equestris TaxID=78828 RepID=UPI0009E1A1ED|nr:uncharacterized protein LOC110022981 [Phalaenopsis equestris]
MEQMLPHKSNDSSFDAYPLSSYEETVEDLRSTLWSTSWELEELRKNVREELRKKDDDINHLIQLLNAANQERDEARDQLQMLLNHHRRSQTPQFILPKCSSSSFTNSKNLSDLQNHHSYIHSPLVNPIGSSGGKGGNAVTGIVIPSISCKYEYGEESRLEQLMNKPLPEKGKLLEAVMAAGPLLCSLMVVGELPQWRNPPFLNTLAAAPQWRNPPSLKPSAAASMAAKR